MLPTHRPTWVAAVLGGVAFLAFALWYRGGPPLTGGEIDRYMATIESQPPESIGDLDVARFRRFLEADDGQPFYNVNLFKFRDRARYSRGEEPGLSGQDAFRRYGTFMQRTLPSRGSHVTFVSTRTETADWDLVAIARYRSRRDFAELLASPEFASAVVDKWAGLERNLRVPLQSRGLLANAYWPVAALLASVVLLVNRAEALVRWRRKRRRAQDPTDPNLGDDPRAGGPRSSTAAAASPNPLR